MFEFEDTLSSDAVIKVIGVGGGGGNAVNHMVASELTGVEFICANTDAQALKKIDVRTVLQLGTGITKGLGAGAKPEIGRQAAIEDKEHIAAVLKGTDMVFITAGLGGGTGTGAAPVVAEVAKDMGVLTVAVVTKPFRFEKRKRMQIAEQGLEELKERVDSLIIIPNDKLLPVMGDDADLVDCFSAANDVLLRAVQGISELITKPGLINVDFADVKTVMSEMGLAMMGTGIGTGENRAEEATRAAIASPLMENTELRGARGVLVNISASQMTIKEFDLVGSLVEEYADEDATVIVGTSLDPELGENIKVTVVATGLGQHESRQETRRRGEGRIPHMRLVRDGGGDSGRAPRNRGLESDAVLEDEEVAADVRRPIRKGGAEKRLFDPKSYVMGQRRPPAGGNTAEELKSDEEDYDLPTFLRRQAD